MEVTRTLLRPTLKPGPHGSQRHLLHYKKPCVSASVDFFSSSSSSLCVKKGSALHSPREIFSLPCALAIPEQGLSPMYHKKHTASMSNTRRWRSDGADKTHAHEHHRLVPIEVVGSLVARDSKTRWCSALSASYCVPRFLQLACHPRAPLL